MSTTKKVLIIILTIVLVAAFAFAITWGIINWSKVKEGMKGNGLYTQEDIQKSYEDGFNKALSDKNEYEKLINSYKDTITTQNDLISQHTSEITMLNNSIKDYEGQIKLLTEQKSSLETQISTLTEIKTANEATISELNVKIESLSKQVIKLQGDAVENATMIENLNSQISNLQQINSQLKATNELNTQTIENLNNQNNMLNNQIAELNMQMQNNYSTVSTLNAKISELQKSVQYYEQFLKTLEQGEQIIATFEFAVSVYYIQVVNKNSQLTVVNPTSTEYVIFNGWTVNGETIDLATYRITENTRIIADVTYKYDVKFMANNENLQSSIMLKDSKITPPEAPAKAGYAFEGWTIDGSTIIDFETFRVNQHTTFTAKFVKQYTVTFEYDGTIISSQTINAGQCATAPETTDTAYKIFNGWKLNNIITDITQYKINENTAFVADITYKYNVTFMVDDEVISSQIIAKNTTATEIDTPVKENFVFDCWTLDGTNSVNIGSYRITENTTFVAKFKHVFIVEFVVNDSIYNTQSVIEGEKINIVSNPNVDGYIFLGWTTNGVDIISNINNVPITSNMRYIAKFTIHGATLVDGNTFKSSVNTSVSHIVFDKYSDENKEYFVDGKNILKGHSQDKKLNLPTSDFDIDYYMIYNTFYVLSEKTIVFNADCSNMFHYYSRLESIKFNNIDTSNVTNMSRMFGSLGSVASLDLRSFNTSNVTDMSNMFDRSGTLKSINLTSFDTRNVTKMSYMFGGCDDLITLDLSNFNTSKVENMQDMFRECRALKTLDISSFDTSNLKSISRMFYMLIVAETIYVGEKWDVSNVEYHSDVFYYSKKLPNFDENTVDKSRAHAGSDGYLTFKG